VYNIADINAKASKGKQAQAEKSGAKPKQQKLVDIIEEEHGEEIKVRDSLSTENISELSANIPNPEDTEVNEEADHLVIQPLAHLRNIGSRIVSLKWILNDTFLCAITDQNDFIVFDSLCYAFELIPAIKTPKNLARFMTVWGTKDLSNRSLLDNSGAQFMLQT
jgi:hypothetical protein